MRRREPGSRLRVPFFLANWLRVTRREGNRQFRWTVGLAVLSLVVSFVAFALSYHFQKSSDRTFKKIMDLQYNLRDSLHETSQWMRRNPQDSTGSTAASIAAAGLAFAARNRSQTIPGQGAPRAEEKIDVRRADKYWVRGDSAFASGNMQRAIVLYDTAIALNPNSADMYVSRGRAKRESGDTAGGRVDYQRAIVLDPKNELAHYNLARAYLDLEQWDSAHSHATAAKTLNAQFTRAMWIEALVQNFGFKDWRKATDLLDMAIKIGVFSLSSG